MSSKEKREVSYLISSDNAPLIPKGISNGEKTQTPSRCTIIKKDSLPLGYF